jgi:DNA-binding NtrC family response regulator
VANLLIIDDDPEGAGALADVMVDGYNGEEGLRLVYERVPDLALLDVEMPVLNGPGMAYQLLIHDMGLELIPVVLLSGVTNLGEVAEQVGTPYFLGKPYRYEQIVALIGRALAERTPPRPTALADCDPRAPG